MLRALSTPLNPNHEGVGLQNQQSLDCKRLCMDAGVSNISLSPAFLQAIDALLQVGNIAAARTLLAPFQRGEGE